MKLLLLSLVLIGQLMDFKEFENLIGKDISHARQILLHEGFEYHNTLEINLYTSDSHHDFYTMSYNMISIITDEKNMLKSVTIHFHQIIDSNFYDSFIINYGNPDTIQVIDRHDFVGEWTKEEEEERIEHRVRKNTLIMREGKFEENPLLIIWNKKDYQIKALLKHEQSISEITFRESTDKF